MARHEEDRPVHPIGVAAERTGLTPDVLRVWERRYGVVDPARDDAGRRLYSDADVERLGLLAAATAAGRGISQVAALTVAELRELVRSDAAARWSADRSAAPGESAESMAAVVERALGHTYALDAPALEGELRRAATLLGLTDFLEGVVAPLFRRIGDEWHSGGLSVSQEHLASGVAGAVLSRLAGELAGSEAAPLMVVGTPAGEYHGIGALLVWALAAAAGWRVVYLGPNVPAAEIVGAAVVTEARCVALSVVFVDSTAVASELAEVRRGLPAGVDVIVGGGSAEALAGVAGLEGLKWLSDLSSLRSYLQRSV
jgi:MerR family transcriptional regulator, light-induced transcriptional regulator